LNILSMRSVMRNPPTMLLVAQTTATKPSSVATRLCAAPAAMSDPTSEIPEIALVAAISGVCSSGGTRVITMYPVNAARTKTYNSSICISYSVILSVAKDLLSLPQCLSIKRHHHRSYDLGTRVELHRSILHQLLAQLEDVPAEHLAG